MKTHAHVALDEQTHHAASRAACHEHLLTGCTYLRAAPRRANEAARICSQGWLLLNLADADLARWCPDSRIITRAGFRNRGSAGPSSAVAFLHPRRCASPSWWDVQ